MCTKFRLIFSHSWFYYYFSTQLSCSKIRMNSVFMMQEHYHLLVSMRII